jgi:lipopolysaccharide transport system ATP-binding protein
MADSAIVVSDLSKKFRRYTERRTTLREQFVRGRGKRDEDFWALRDINFEVERGTTFGLVGHNGSGKSTLLKILAGIHRPTTGSVSADGRLAALLELGSGFHPELTGRQNIYLNGAILGLSRKQVNKSMEEIIDFSGVEEFIDAPVKVYSSGMVVRLGFSIAVKVEPEILLVDEIIAVGDEQFQRKCMDHLFHLRQAGTTIVIVGHALMELRQLCSRGVWIEHGHQRMVGTISKVCDAYLAEVNLRETAATTSAESIIPIEAVRPLSPPGAPQHSDPDSVVNTGSAPDEGSDQVDEAIPDESSGAREWGTREIVVTAVDMLDGEGRRLAFTVPDTSVMFRLHYRASMPQQDVGFALEVKHESGTIVATPNSWVSGVTFDLDPGVGHVDMEVPQLNLLPGEYEIGSYVASRGHTFHARYGALELRLRPGAGDMEPGLARIPNTWSSPSARIYVE